MMMKRQHFMMIFSLYNGNIQEGVWTDYTVPISELGAPAMLNKIWLKEISNNVPETIYLDDIGVQ